MVAKQATIALRVALVGPCASGKSTLATALREAGYEVRMPAQEHSYVPYMWQRITKPDVLIYLDVDYAHVVERRPKNPGSLERLIDQHERLAHARAHCDFYLDTSGKRPFEIAEAVSGFLELFTEG